MNERATIKSCKSGIYEKGLKRYLDFLLSLIALIILSPVFIILIIAGMIAMRGNPFFVQPRPGKDERIFYMIKFRTMTNARDKNGNFLPDEERLNRYGKFLRNTSLDELPELLNILEGDLSVVGPRPQLVRDMVFMSPEHRRRHCVRQGLTGLAQVNGRNNITWEQKLDWDLKYIDSGITFLGDVKILLATIGKVLNREGIATEGMETAEDYGDYLLRTEKIDEAFYCRMQKKAEMILWSSRR